MFLLNKMNDERTSSIAGKVWNNLVSSNLLDQIVEKSQHGSSDISTYSHADFWTDVGGKNGEPYMWIQIHIKPINGGQPVTPKIYRLTEVEEEQRTISERIWQGVTIDDVLHISSVSAQDFHERDQKKWLRPYQSIGIEEFYPLSQKGLMKAELSPKFAQYIVMPK